MSLSPDSILYDTMSLIKTSDLVILQLNLHLIAPERFQYSHPYGNSKKQIILNDIKKILT
jgi:hypothetical protein